MKNDLKWQFLFGGLLIFLSGAVYYIHYLIFHDAHHIFIYLIGDIAFVFLEVLFVTLIIHRLLVYRDKQSLLNKMNMVIGVFFSEVGTELLKKISFFDRNSPKIAERLIIDKAWSKEQFCKIKNCLVKYESNIDISQADLNDLRSFLVSERTFLVNLLQNSNLLEHDSFTNTLWGVFHLAEELSKRKDCKILPVTDLEHLAGDIRRAYELLVVEWLDYVEHLRKNYPYLFSLAVRTNPFDKAVSVVVRGK